jgi:hypothetical protein
LTGWQAAGDAVVIALSSVMGGFAKANLIGDLTMTDEMMTLPGARRARIGGSSATATATGTEQRGPERWNCASRGCGAGRTSPASSSRGGWPRRRCPRRFQQAYIHGVSTRSVDDLMKALGMSGVSKSQVSRLCAEIDERVTAFLDRPLEGDWPYLWIDATYLKVRQNGRIVSVAVIAGRRRQHRRPARGAGHGHGPSEVEPFWVGFLRKLARRGLRGVKLVISDAHEGLKAAISKILSATWQRCRVHFMRNALAHAGKSGRRVVSAFVATAFAQDDTISAKQQWRRVADQLRPKVPKLAALMDEAEDDVLAYMTFPASTGRSCTPRIRSSASTARSSAAPRSSASSPTSPPSHASSAPSSSSRTTSGPKALPLT